VALGDFAAAKEAYQKLVLNRPGEADAIRNFADELTQAAMEKRDYKKAVELASLSLELQPNRAAALVKLGQAQLALGDFAAATEVTRKLKSMYPSGASQVLEYADSLTDWAFEQGRFDQAARLASFELDFVPNREPVMTKLAESQFASANFPAAAVTYRKLLDHQVGAKEQLNLALIRSYADALGATPSPAQAVRDFESFLASAKLTAPSQLVQGRIELAGIKVLAGDQAPAQAEAQDRSVPPEFMARLGWWYYRAGEYATATSVLRGAVHVRPGDAALENNLAWAELEQGQLPDAEQRFTLAMRGTNSAGPPLWNTPQMGRAVARWQASLTDDALTDFEPVVKNLQQWLNPNWVKALYSTRMTESVTQMEAERQRRLEARRRASRPAFQPRR
jgi:tetratricopeptide (TPR) repeat protein